ncbi:MAG TPA: YraN family protein, partial [Chloroflexota bacterium]|nr:YraN family protein [Chloroflexota bacterium]
MSNRSLGTFGENWAVGYLTRAGYRILERNVRLGRDEIDIVARDGADLVFVEVKCRRGSQFGLPEEAITPARYARLARAAERYFTERGGDASSYR